MTRFSAGSSARDPAATENEDMKIFIIILIFLWVNVGFKRDYAALQTHLKIEKFNYKRYKAFKAKNKEKDTLGDGSIVAYYEDNDIYQEELQLPNSLITINKQYYKDNFRLKSEIKFLSAMEIGVGKFYNHSGILFAKLIMKLPLSFP